MVEQIRFVINTPSHKRWYLPDGVHQVNSVIYGDEIHMAVLDSRDIGWMYGERATFKLDKHNKYQDYCDLFVQLAEKKYRKRTVSEQYRQNRYGK